jgi:phospholipid/cholesterol/gamma-HCH transport system permease protein
MNWTSPLDAVGRSTLGVLTDFGRFSRFTAETARALPDVRTWVGLTIVQMRRLGVNSLPIALFLAAFTGIVMALQASYTFTGAIPVYFVGTLVGKTLILELGPVLTGLALSGRVGANIAAQLGTMRVSEQIDALETMAYNPVSYLVVPRVVASTIMVPHHRDLRHRARHHGRVDHGHQPAGHVTQQFVRGLRSSTIPSTSPTR